MIVEVIVSTYNSVHALELALESIAVQNLSPNSICIADDGSGPETAIAVKEFQAAHPELSVRHVWHEDRGFEKNVILNKAVSTSVADFLIFTDGDCIIHPCFIQRHVDLAHTNQFSCGSLIRLSDAATKTVTKGDVFYGTIFSDEWLRKNDSFNKFTTYLKSMPWNQQLLSMLEILWPIRRTWCGANASAFRTTILKINGFDETMKYGGGDKEFGVRLKNNGIRGRHLRFTAPLIHLDHPRSYKDSEKRKKHRAMIAHTRATRKTWTEHGIDKIPMPEAIINHSHLQQT